MRVFFNASVILAGLGSPMGGSGKLLRWSQQKRFTGVISEIIFDEVNRQADKLGMNLKQVIKKISQTIAFTAPVPSGRLVNKYKQVVVDQGDAHVLASAQATKSKFLVTLDKKHILSLKSKIKKLKIVSPGELITILSRSEI
ncbi:MAG: PIN domain-containing protein [Candidatus Chisholmbacteria bacterium]|nr:PIN domain-containing protein [Candidatus Chisholmbacteria bacterium]